MKLFVKYVHLNVHFICERDGQVVEVIHMECTGEYQTG